MKSKAKMEAKRSTVSSWELSRYRLLSLSLVNIIYSPPYMLMLCCVMKQDGNELSPLGTSLTRLDIACTTQQVLAKNLLV